jgi:hypothetical protein
MTKQDDYRRNAADSIGLANRASSTADKARLLGLAEAWLDLAQRAHKAASTGRQPAILHPLLQRKLHQYPD